MADYNATNIVKLAGLRSLAQRTKTELAALDTKYSTAFRSLAVNNGVVSFYTSTDASGEAAYTFNFPEEIFLDQTHTTFVEDFKFRQSLYPGAEDPDLDGKAVLVLGVKGDFNSPTIKYSFVDLDKLIDIYVPGNSSISIDGYNVAVRISEVANNSITLQADGLHVDITGKADRVVNAVAGNFVTLDANGNIVDSGIAFAPDTDINAMISEIFDGAQQP